MFENLVFEGGGVKVVGFLGALEVLKNNGHLANIKNVAGTSAGGGVAALYAMGYTIDELREIIFKLDLGKFQDDSFGFIRDTNRLLKKYGIYQGKTLKKFYEKLFYQKTKIRQLTFAQLYRLNGFKLVITGTCLTDMKLTYFSVDTTPEMIISDAVRISQSIPFVFTPVLYGDKYYVDGGLLSNLPTECFDLQVSDDRWVNKKTLSIRLDTEYDLVNKNVEITNLFSFINSIINTVTENAYRINYAQDEDSRKIIKIYTDNISVTNFKINLDEKNALYKNGIEATQKFLQENNCYQVETPYREYIGDHNKTCGCFSFLKIW